MAFLAPVFAFLGKVTFILPWSMCCFYAFMLLCFSLHAFANEDHLFTKLMGSLSLPATAASPPWVNEDALT